jgi:hypothetical protein
MNLEVPSDEQIRQLTGRLALNSRVLTTYFLAALLKIKIKSSGRGKCTSQQNQHSQYNTLLECSIDT